jgi:hypothetical protein
MSNLLDKTRLLGTSGAIQLAAPAIIRRAFAADERRRGRAFTTDAMMTYDWQTIDSTGSFLIGELERLDQTLHDPLVAVTWARDIDLREDVSMADEVSSFTNSAFSAPGGIVPTGISWISKDANAISGVGLDIGKTAQNLNPWGMEVKYTLLELASAQKLGRPVDAQKYDGMKLKWQMDVDQLVYIGDSLGGGYGSTGLVNNPSVSTSNVAVGASGSTLWATKTPDEILADVNTLLTNTYLNSGTAILPDELRLPPVQFSYLVSQKVSNAGNVSILEFLRNNSMTNASYGKPLRILPVKWLTGRGVGGSNRMICYTKDKDRVRFPLVPLQRTPIEYRSIWQSVTYYGRMGTLEVVYSETLGYADGL